MKLNKKNIMLILSILVSIVCTWLFIRTIEWNSLKNALKGTNYWLIIPIVILAQFVYVVRAVRWKVLLSHIKPIPVIHLLSITTIGFLANNILPARVGEVLRPFLLYRKKGIKFSTSLSTVVVERIFDMFGLILFTVVVISLLPHPETIQYNSQIHIPPGGTAYTEEPALHSLKNWVGVFAIIGILTSICLFSVIIKPDFFKGLLSRICSFLPHRMHDKIFDFYGSFIYGMKILESKVETIWILVFSILVWVMSGLEVYFLALSFNIDLPFVCACLVAVFLSLAIALPQAPGYIGVFHIAVVKSLDIFGIKSAAAQSYAITLWAINVFPIIMLGFFFLWREGIAFREVARLEEEITEGKLEELEGISKEPPPA